MITISSFADLQGFGIKYLTGESCPFYYRGLFDFTERGRKIIAEALGITDFKGAESWNCGSANAPHVGSIMLPYNAYTMFAPFALFSSGCTIVDVYTLNDQQIFHGFRSDETEEEEAGKKFMREAGYAVRQMRYDKDRGTRNRHQMSGRTE